MPFLNAVLWPAFRFVEKNRWAQIVLGLGIGWLIIMIYLWVRDSGIRKLEREKIKADQARVREAVNERKDEIISQERTSADTALEARNREYPPTSFDELPNDEKRVLDRRFRSGEAS
jgi:hypothetical protein